MGRPTPPEPLEVLTVKVPQSVKRALFRRGKVSARIRALLEADTYFDRMDARAKEKEPEDEGLVI